MTTQHGCYEVKQICYEVVRSNEVESSYSVRQSNNKKLL
jgi:hypothetical protein